MSEPKLVNLLDILNYSSNLFQERGIPDGRLNAELLMAESLRCRRIDLYLNYDKPLTEKEREAYKVLLRRRLNNEPLQYILSRTEFYNSTFYVNDKVLIPRQETERLVETVLKHIEECGMEKPAILDIGTGSGCISISLSKELKKKEMSHRIRGIDISTEALEVANHNLEINGIERENVEFKEGDIFSDDFVTDGFDIVVSNPPYIPISEYRELEPEIRNYEPEFALTDYSDGLKYYRRIFNLTLKSRTVSAVFLEIAYNKRDEVEKAANDSGIKKYRFHKDYNDIFRILEIRKQ